MAPPSPPGYNPYMIHKAIDPVQDNFTRSFGGNFKKRAGASAPRPLGSSIRNEGPMPQVNSDLPEWLIWSMDDSSVASTFWTCMLHAPDPAWSSMRSVAKHRLEALFESDGHMVYSKLAPSMFEMAEEGHLMPLLRFVELAQDQDYRPWMLGHKGRCARRQGLLMDTDKPPIYAAHIAGLHLGNESSVLLSADSQQALNDWISLHGSETLAGNKHFKELSALSLCGSLFEPQGVREHEKEMAKLLWRLSDSETHNSLWVQFLRAGEDFSLQACSFFGAPALEPKKLIDSLGKCGFGGKGEELQRIDAQACILAHRLGWIHVQTLSRCAKTARKENLPILHALLEERLIALSANKNEPTAPSRPGPRI